MSNTAPTKRRRSNTLTLTRGRSTPLPMTPVVAKPSTFGRPLSDSLRVLVKSCLIIFLTLISIAVDLPVSWMGFEELTLVLQRSSGQVWNTSMDAQWYFWLFVTVISTLSLAHFTLNWRSYGRNWRSMLRGFLFVTLILVPSQLWDFMDSTAGIYVLFQPIDFFTINVLLLYASIAGAIFGSFVAPTFALLLAREGNNAPSMPHPAKGMPHDHA